MKISALKRGASIGALALLVSSESFAQQTLPTIDVGGAQRASATRGPATRYATRGAHSASRPSTPAPAAPGPAAASRFPSEPKTPEEGYVVRDASTGTKADIPIRQTPVSVQVVPKQVIQDQNVTTLQDALENVPGVRSNNNELEGYNFIIRGFQSLYIYRNNLAIPGGESNPSTFDTANIERIEVLKGPSSILFGRAEPGGLINIITKQPLENPLYRVEQQIGSFNHYRTQWDISTPIASVPGLAARVSGAYQNNGSFRRFQGGERVLVAPVVSYRPSDWTEFTVDTQFLAQRAQSDMGTPPIPPNPMPVPLSRSFQEPNDPRDRINSYNIGYKFRQNLTSDWKITNRFLYSGLPSTQKLNASILCVTLACVDTDGRTLQRIGQYQDLIGRTFSTNIDIEGKFTTFGAKHNFLFGLDYLNGYYDYYFGNGASLYPIDIFNPVYGGIPSFAYDDSIVGTGFKFHSSVLTRQKGMYVQDQINFLDDKLHLLIGTRYDVAHVNRGTSQSDFSAFPDLGPVLAPSENLAIADRLSKPGAGHTAWSPRAGLVYDLLPQLSVYGSYSRSFGVQNGVGANRDLLPPQRGLQWEVGLKAEPLPGLTANLAFFQITKTGIGTRDFSSTDPTAQKLTGAQRSRGIEFDVMGRVTDRVALVANYAYIDAKVIGGDPVNRLNPFGTLDQAEFGFPSGLLNNHLDNVPRHSGKIFATYDFGDNGLGLRVGGGVTASTKAWGDIQNTFLMPGWARLDAFASYATLVEGHKVTAQLNLKNINNAQYYSGVDNFFNFNAPPLNLLPAPPFTAVGQIKFEW